jgi:hypothetical protein
MRRVVIACAILSISACAGRSPNPVAVSQIQDPTMSCAAIQAEMNANNNTVRDLSEEGGAKVAQNIAAGVAGVLIWPLWFAMDFQDAAGKETVALNNRNVYLGSLAATRCSVANRSLIN